MSHKSGLSAAAVCLLVLLFSLAFAGCDDSDSPSSGGSGSSGDAGAAVPASLSGLEREAADAVMAEIAKHWSKGPDGWTTALAEGSGFAPIKFIRQVKSLSVDHVEANELSEADKLNGFEWAGDVHLKRTVGREAGTNGIVFGGEAGPSAERHPGRWSQWVDHDPSSVRAQKLKGKWQFRQDTTLIAGAPPTDQDYAAAGVK